MTMLHSRTEATGPVTAHTENTVPTTFARKALAVLRIAFGLTFLWAFFDKLLALGFSTGVSVNPETGVETVDRFGDAAWINGGNPTLGFLKFGADGPFKGFYNSIAGDAWVNWSFMLALLGLGIALTFGVGMRVAAIGGTLLYLMMWSVALLPENNPIIDDHILGAITLVVLAAFAAGDTWGLGHWWSRTDLVQKNPALR
jgi:thiosulfate dehydrogenase [quinone] large subunit